MRPASLGVSMRRVQGGFLVGMSRKNQHTSRKLQSRLMGDNLERYAGFTKEQVVVATKRNPGRLPTITFACGGVEEYPSDVLYGRTGGGIKRYMGGLAKKLGYSRIQVFQDRDGSGFHFYADREQRDDDLYKKEYNRIIPIIKRQIRALCKKHGDKKVQTPPPVRVSFHLSTLSPADEAPENAPSVWRLYVYFNYRKGHYVTPTEIL